ncbi:UMP kinase activity protein [Homalodisca vitripennis]|nr:UMP kinase activity protein [Homalodisca vitripennis]
MTVSFVSVVAFFLFPQLKLIYSDCEHNIRNINAEKGNYTYCVYHSIEEVLNVLVPALKQQPPLPEVMQVYHKDPMVMKAVMPIYNRKPFIVIEGVQGTKKTLLAKRLAQEINGTYIRNPPFVMEKLYHYLDDHCSQVSSAFMAFGNYIVAEQAKTLLPTHPVVLDKYWHGVTAFNLAKAAQDLGIEIPQPSSLVYYWPEDLLMPDLAFYIMVSDEVLKFRFHKTFKKVYPKDFRNNIHKALMRMTSPKMWRINGNLKRIDVESQISMRVYKMFSRMLFPEINPKRLTA